MITDKYKPTSSAYMKRDSKQIYSALAIHSPFSRSIKHRSLLPSRDKASKHSKCNQQHQWPERQKLHSYIQRKLWWNYIYRWRDSQNLISISCSRSKYCTTDVRSVLPRITSRLRCHMVARENGRQVWKIQHPTNGWAQSKSGTCYQGSRGCSLKLRYLQSRSKLQRGNLLQSALFIS